jgi:hypothetical protein
MVWRRVAAPVGADMTRFPVMPARKGAWQWRSILRFATVAAGMCASHLSQAAPPEGLAGTWRGTTNQTGAAAFTVELRLWQTSRGVLAGTAQYPERGCSSELRQFEADPRGAMFEELMVKGSGCVDRGKIFIAPAGAGRVGWLWFAPRPSSEMADATLAAVQASAPSAPPVALTIARPSLAHAPSNKELEASAYRLAREMDALLDGPFQPFKTNEEIFASLARLKAQDKRGFALAQFSALMPRFVDSESVFRLAASQAATHRQFSDETSALARDYQAVMVEMKSDWSSMVIAVGVQSAWHQLLRLGEKASNSNDATASLRYRKLIDVAHSTAPLRSLVALSARHDVLYGELFQRYLAIAHGRASGVQAQLRANDILAVFEALGPNDLKQAQAEVDRLSRWRTQYLAQAGASAVANVLGAVLGGGESSSTSTLTIKRCTKRYAPITAGTDLYSGGPTTYGGEFLGEDCSEN